MAECFDKVEEWRKSQRPLNNNTISQRPLNNNTILLNSEIVTNYQIISTLLKCCHDYLW